MQELASPGGGGGPLLPQLPDLLFALSLSAHFLGSTASAQSSGCRREAIRGRKRIGPPPPQPPAQHMPQHVAHKCNLTSWRILPLAQSGSGRRQAMRGRRRIRRRRRRSCRPASGNGLRTSWTSPCRMSSCVGLDTSLNRHVLLLAFHGLWHRASHKAHQQCDG